MSVFDGLGFLAISIIQDRIILQIQLKIDRDDPISGDIYNKGCQLVNRL